MTDGADPEAEIESLRVAASAIGLDLAEPDLQAVAGFLGALRPGLDALVEAARSTSTDDDEHHLSTTFDVEWP